MSSIIFPTTTTTLLVNTLSANKFVYLPPISTVNAGSVYFIKDICGNSAVSSIYIYAAGSDTIERQNAGSASALLNANFGSVLLMPDGISNWMVLQHYTQNVITKIWKAAPTPISSVTLSFIPENTYILATWSASTNLVSYTATFYSNSSNSNSNGTLFQTITGITTLYVKSTTTLTANTYYYAIITTINTAGSSSLTTSTVYTSNLPPVPQMVSISSLFPLLTCTWYPSLTATTYNVVFYQNTTAQSTVGATTFQTFNGVSVLTQTTSSSPSTTNGYYYYATVVAVNGALLSTPVAQSAIIIVKTAPGAVTNVVFSFVYPNFLVTWSASTQTLTYTIVFYQSTSPSNSGGTSFQTFTGVTSTTQTSSTLATVNYYCYAIVSSVNSYTTTSVTSSYVQATLTPGAVSNVSFSFVYPNFLVTWSASTQTSSYTIVFYQLSTPANTGGASFQTFTGVTNTTQTSSTIARLNYYCYAIVTSVNPYTGATTSVSSSYVQATLAPTVTNVSVSLSYPNLLVTWISIQASSYTVYFYSSGGSLLETDTPATTSQTSAFALTDGASYYVTVTATNPYTSTTVTTSPQQISLQPTVNSVTMSFSGNQATATWTTTSGTSFTVTFYENSSNSTTGGTQKEIATSVTGTSRATTATLTSGLYYYATVQAFNANGQSSIVLSSSAIQAAILPTGGAITLGSILQTTGGSVTITSAASLATGYTVYISTSTSPTGFNFTTTTVGSSVSFTTTLTGNTIYYAVLVPYNIYGNGTVSYSSGVLSSLYSYSGTLTFTPASATGSYGPNLSQCKTAYSSFGSWINNTAYFNMTVAGIQQWTVPQTRNYTITCAGAGGPNGVLPSGTLGTNSGAILTATFSLTQGQVINILVGQAGTSAVNYQYTYYYGGSGGSFVVTSGGTPLIVAGGANGGGTALLTNNGTTNGGAAGPNITNTTADSVQYGHGGGGGLVGNGVTNSGSYQYFFNGGTGDWSNGGGYSYTNGGIGGGGSGTCSGGFGGGGAAGSYISYRGYATTPPTMPNSEGGGGGGYSGDGGSYCSTTITSSSVTNTGQGYVSIT